VASLSLGSPGTFEFKRKELAHEKAKNPGVRIAEPVPISLTLFHVCAPLLKLFLP
jgi:hypothetical protein